MIYGGGFDLMSKGFLANLMEIGLNKEGKLVESFIKDGIVLN